MKVYEYNGQIFILNNYRKVIAYENNGIVFYSIIFNKHDYWGDSIIFNTEQERDKEFKKILEILKEDK